MSDDVQDPAFEALLEHLKSDRGFDFTGYKRASLRRRVAKRMATVDVDDVEAYQDHLEVHPDEFAHLFDTILINVTSWFRDPTRWTYLADEIVPTIVARRADDPIRIWSAGCATGEEAYSIAMLFAEAMGDTTDRMKIYATDVDERALSVARQASFTADDLDDVPPDLRERWFTQKGTRSVIRADLRRTVIFGRHDLVRDAPISRLDLILCRNALMYFNRETQSRVLRHLHFALRDEGYLFLGDAEMMLARSEQFDGVSLGNRVFRKSPRDRPSRPRSTSPAITDEAVATQIRMRDSVFATTPVAQVVVDADGVLTLANTEARSLFGLGERDFGRHFLELELSYRPVELRTHLDAVLGRHRPVHLQTVERELDSGDWQHLEIRLTPLDDGKGRLLGIAIAFRDVTQAERLRARLHQAHQDLEEAYQSLQSTNEELETLNGELQTATLDQEEVNHELTVQSAERERLTVYLHSIVGSLDAAVVVVDADGHVELWNDTAVALWGLRPDEVRGRSLLHLDIGLPVGELDAPIREVLAGSDKVGLELVAIDRRGFRLGCRVMLTPLLGSGDLRQGVVVLIQPRPADHGGTG